MPERRDIEIARSLSKTSLDVTDELQQGDNRSVPVSNDYMEKNNFQSKLASLYSNRQ